MKFYACWLADLRDRFVDRWGANWVSAAANFLAAFATVNFICVAYFIDAAWLVDPPSKAVRALLIVGLFFVMDALHRAAIGRTLQRLDLGSLPSVANRMWFMRVWTYAAASLAVAVLVVVFQL